LTTRPNPIVLLVIDGWGISDNKEGNAIYHAATPNMDYLIQNYPSICIQASGLPVGLPEGVMGNSEVGHLTIGIGRITYQSYERVNQSIKNNDLKDNDTLIATIDHVKSHNSKFHLFGLLSDGGVHSHINHLKELIKILHENKVDKAYIHAFTDGRDVPPTSSHLYVKEILDFLDSYENYVLSDLIGRYYAMDRDKRWERTKIAYEMLTNNREEDQICIEPLKKIQERYDKNENDEFLKPIIISKEGIVEENDAILFFNFRPDRARQLTQAFTTKLNLFERKVLDNLFYTTMTRYDESFINTNILFPPEMPKNSIAEIYSKSGYKQMHIAETEKYAHVTYFINGGQEEKFENEDRILVPSIQSVPTYDLAPEMSTIEIGEKVIEVINTTENGSHKYDLIIFNIAAPDMVGHTGVFEATIKAVEVTDRIIGDVYKTCKARNYTFIITADHGNAEKLIDNSKPHTAHTTNPVPFIITDKKVKLKSEGGLSNVAPTLLDLAGITPPNEMTSSSLIIK
jgi:2,3-bisphosphoglycerate-independent phosphoglycerate mutase